MRVSCLPRARRFVVGCVEFDWLVGWVEEIGPTDNCGLIRWMVAAPMETLRYEDTDCGLRDDRLRCSQGGHIFYAGGSIAGKMSPTLATPTTLALTTPVAQCELCRR